MSKKSRARAAAKMSGGASPPPEPDAFFVRRGALVASGIVVFAALAAYHNSFFGPFILDDPSAITDNQSIRHLGSALSPPSDVGVGGRPLLNLTFALNYALGGMNVGGYHACNLLIHALAGLTLFGIVRRTLLRPAFVGLRRAGLSPLNSGAISQGLSLAEAWMLALAVALIWVVHPLQTEAVTYISQRAESLMGLFYLLTLYCFIRSQDSGDRRQETGSLPNAAFSFQPSLSVVAPPATRSPVKAGAKTEALWLTISVLACLLGTMAKEIIVTAPVMVLLYDRTFIAGSWREAWRQRWWYYLGLAATWLLLAHLMTGLNQRGAGFGEGVTWSSYALTSCRSVVLYLKLAVWPHPLVLDYGTDTVQNAADVLPYGLVLALLLAGTAVALWRWPVVGFAGAWLFLILAPTSSIVPVAGQPMAEHRMYLSLAAVVTVVLLGMYAWIGRRSAIVFAAAAVGLGWMSVLRNEDYRSELAIFRDTVAKCPGNARARYNLGMILAGLNRPPEAITEYETALRIKPDYEEAHYNLGIALAKIPGRLPDAISHFESALRIKPNDAEAHNNLGIALASIPDRSLDGIAHFEAALRIKPDYAEAHYNLGIALAKIPDRLPDAILEYEAALKINPGFVQAYFNLGNAWSQQGRYASACEAYEEVLKLKPGYADGHVNLGLTLAIMGRLDEAITQFKTALQINPDDPSVYRYLELAQATRLQSRGEDLRKRSAP
jgi:protein O-mannosyl-transferase